MFVLGKSATIQMRCQLGCQCFEYMRAVHMRCSSAALVTDPSILT
jgi:hypothetical protein